MNKKDELLITEIAGLVNGIDNKYIAIAALLKMAIAVGCKNHKKCKNCPLRNLCQDIYRKANNLEQVEELEEKGDDINEKQTS